MRFSINTAVAFIVALLFLASIISVYFALKAQNTIPLTLVAGANIIAVILLIFLITRGVVHPLKTIRRAIQQVGRGDFTPRIQVNSTKEMEELGRALNEMIEKLGAAQEAVKTANSVLEMKVKERTHQLQDLTQSLEEKVQARTKELKERLEELERFQKLAVGRELKMIELKEEIQRLETKVAPKTPRHAKTQRKNKGG